MLSTKDKPKISFAWKPRSIALTPTGLAARGAAAITLARRLCELDDGSLARLRGAAAPGLLVVLADELLLPWVDRVLYLGQDTNAPSLLLPTTIEPEIPLALLERALTPASGAATPLAVLTNPPLIASTAVAQPISRQQLIKWLEENISSDATDQQER